MECWYRNIHSRNTGFSLLVLKTYWPTLPNLLTLGGRRYMPNSGNKLVWIYVQMVFIAKCYRKEWGEKKGWSHPKSCLSPWTAAKKGVLICAEKNSKSTHSKSERRFIQEETYLGVWAISVK